MNRFKIGQVIKFILKKSHTLTYNKTYIVSEVYRNNTVCKVKGCTDYWSLSAFQEVLK